MKKSLILLCAMLMVCAVAYGADQVIQYNEQMVGAGHPTLSDTLNRALLVDHETDGTHSADTIGTLQIIDETINNVDIATDAAIDASKIGGGTVSNTEFGYLNGVTSAIQTQLNTLVVADNSITPAKLQTTSGTADNTTFFRGDGAWATPAGTFQPLDSDLSVLSFPTAWRLFYSNGSNAVTELTLGASGTYLISQGASSAPVFSALDSDLTTLAAPTAWRLYYSGASGYSALAFGTADLCLKSGGASAAPTWGTCGTGGEGTVSGPATATEDNVVTWGADNTTIKDSGVALSSLAPLASPTFTGTVTVNAPNGIVSDNTAITGGTIDTTVIGGTTPAVGTFSSLSVGVVDNTEIGLLNGMDNNIKDTFDLKAPIASPSFTGNATFDNEVTAVQYNTNCNPALGECWFNVLGQVAPSDVTRGNCYLDNTSLAMTCSDGATYSAYSGTVTPSTTDTFTNKTLDAAATGNVLKQYKYINLGRPTSSGATATKISYDSTYSFAGQVMFGGDNTAASGNCADWWTNVPDDIDTSVDLKVLFKFRLNGADTGTHSYLISMSDIPDSSHSATTSGTVDNVALSFSGDANGAEIDAESVGWTTLTGWKSALTANHRLGVSVCRDGSAGGDTSTVDSFTLSLDIKYGSIQ